VYAGRGEQLCQVALKLGNVVVALEATLGSTVELAPSGLLSVFSQQNPLDKNSEKSKERLELESGRQQT